MAESMIDRVARAIGEIEVGYEMQLTKLVDGVSTYTLTYNDGAPPLEFNDTTSVYEHIAHRRDAARARAAIEAMREPTDEIVSAIDDAASEYMFPETGKLIWRSGIAAALNKPVTP